MPAAEQPYADVDPPHLLRHLGVNVLPLGVNVLPLGLDVLLLGVDVLLLGVDVLLLGPRLARP